MSLTDYPQILPTVLIVDDDPAVVIILGKALQGLATVRFASTGQEALERVAQHVPQLILLDMEMPGMSGLEVMAQLKLMDSTVEIPVIFITANVHPAFEEAVFNAGAADYIAKPLSPSVVLARVKVQLALAQALAHLRKMALFDALTGLNNRGAFDKRLAQEWDRVQRQGGHLSVLMLDVDEFKKYNDHFGHPKGDVCLQELAQTLQAVCRRAGDFVARYGGEEFVALLTDTPSHEAAKVAEAICNAVLGLQMAHAPDASHPWVTVSIGCCSGQLPAGRYRSAANQMVKIADEALYQAKQQGRNRVVARRYEQDNDTA